MKGFDPAERSSSVMKPSCMAKMRYSLKIFGSVSIYASEKGILFNIVTLLCLRRMADSLYWFSLSLISKNLTRKELRFRILLYRQTGYLLFLLAKKPLTKDCSLISKFRFILTMSSSVVLPIAYWNSC